jgi:hypothetical protein
MKRNGRCGCSNRPVSAGRKRSGRLCSPPLIGSPKGLLAAEVAALEADDDDLSEMLAVASLIELVRAAG